MHDKMMKLMMSKKKEGKSLSDSDKKAKLQALGGMRDMASQMMGSKLKNLKKVTVASNTPSGLKEGLHKAEDMASQIPGQDDDQDKEPSMYSEGGKVGQLPPEFDRDEDHVDSEHERDNEMRHFNDGGETEGSPEEEASESPEMEASEHDDSIEKIVEEAPEDADELDELIRKLEEKKQKLSQ